MTKDDTILLHGAGEKSSIQGRCDQIRAAIDATTSDYDRWGVGGGAPDPQQQPWTDSTL